MPNTTYPRLMRFPSLPARLAGFRKAQYLTRGKLAEKAHICATTIKNLEESRTGDPRTSTVLRLARALSVKVSDLLGCGPAGFDDDDD